MAPLARWRSSPRATCRSACRRSRRAVALGGHQDAPVRAGDALSHGHDYRVEVPAGTTSATGGKLAEAVTWEFTTPPPRCRRPTLPEGVYGRDPLLFVAFDQRIDPTAVLETIVVRAGGQRRRCASPPPRRCAPMRHRPAGQRGRRGALAGLPRQRDPALRRPGAGGHRPGHALGRRAAHHAQRPRASPLPPMARCAWSSSAAAGTRPAPRWRPGRWSSAIRWTRRPLTGARWPSSPSLPAAEISASGSNGADPRALRGPHHLQGDAQGGHPRQFGQTLERDETVTFNVGSAQPVMVTPWQPLVVLDPSARPQYTVYTINYDTLRVQVYAVQPEDWPAYERFLRRSRAQRTRARPRPARAQHHRADQGRPRCPGGDGDRSEPPLAGQGEAT